VFIYIYLHIYILPLKCLHTLIHTVHSSKQEHTHTHTHTHTSIYIYTHTHTYIYIKLSLSRVVNGVERLQMHRVSTNILNKQSRIAEKRLFSAGGLHDLFTNANRKTLAYYETFHIWDMSWIFICLRVWTRGGRLWTPSWYFGSHKMRSVSSVTEDLSQLFKQESAQWSQLVTPFCDGNREEFESTDINYMYCTTIV
jgi:hypothetical protein